MIYEAYVKADIAHQLVEHGFPLEASHMPHIGFAVGVKIAKKTEDELYSNITQQLAMQWLRDEHAIMILPSWKPTLRKWQVELVRHDKFYTTPLYAKYEDAIDDSLEHALTYISD